VEGCCARCEPGGLPALQLAAHVSQVGGPHAELDLVAPFLPHLMFVSAGGSGAWGRG
jgi:hypothetical protein